MASTASAREFSFQSCLGAGSFGEVYRVTMTSPGGLSKEVAVKMLREGLDPAAQSVQRLRDEGRLLSQLRHPVILEALDFVLLDGRVGLITEFIEGEDLNHCLRGDDRMPPRSVMHVVSEVASALDAAWNAPSTKGGKMNLVHRDIKPSNIRISKHGQVKLLDFGIARSDNVEREARTQTNIMMGSWHYMAPERFVEPHTGPEGDVYALGCILFEGLTGQSLLAEQSPMKLANLAMDPTRYKTFVRKRLLLIPEDVPKGIKELTAICLAYEADRRPSATDLSRRCEPFVDNLMGQTLRQWCRDHRWPQSPSYESPMVGQILVEDTLADAQELPSRASYHDTFSATADVRRPQATQHQTRSGIAPARPAPGTKKQRRKNPRGSDSNQAWLGIAIGAALSVVLLGLILIVGTVGAAGIWAVGIGRPVPAPQPIVTPVPVPVPTPEPKVDTGTPPSDGGILDGKPSDTVEPEPEPTVRPRPTSPRPKPKPKPNGDEEPSGYMNPFEEDGK